MDEPKPPPGGAPAAVRTFSAPERPAYLLVLGFLAFTAALVVLVYVLLPEEGGTAELVMLLTGLAVVALVGATVIQTLTVRLEADAGGLTVSMGHLITRRLPWAAVAVVEEAPRGGSTDVGWKTMGGGRVFIWPDRRRCW